MNVDPAARPVQHWPGGIPAAIRIHPDGNISDETMNEEARGWLLFVTEQWISREAAGIPADDPEYELRQRRVLIEKWASADQGFRNSYHTRAPLRHSATDYPLAALTRINDSLQPDGGIYCLASLDSRPNRARSIKFQIMLYQLDGDRDVHTMPAGHKFIVVIPNPSTRTTHPPDYQFTMADLPSWLWLENAMFTSLSMTRQGTVLFCDFSTFFVVDQIGLKTGRLAILDFNPDGKIHDCILRRPYNMLHVMQYIDGLGKPPSELREGNVGGSDFYNGPMNMDPPLIDILEMADENDEFVFDLGDRDSWTECIELYAPGYLAMESEGNAADYDPAHLRSIDEVCNIHQSMLEAEIAADDE